MGDRFCHQIQTHCSQRHLAPFSLSLQHRYFTEAFAEAWFTNMLYHISTNTMKRKSVLLLTVKCHPDPYYKHCGINKKVLLLVYNFLHCRTGSSYTSTSNFVIRKKPTHIFRLIQGHCPLCSVCSHTIY